MDIELGTTRAVCEGQISFPTGQGSYALCLRLPNYIHLPVGRLGVFHFSPGDYIYFGSAWGPGGLLARLRHHMRLTSRPHWHLDWLRPHALLVRGWFTTVPGDLECEWSQAVQNLPGVIAPAPGFGAGDCRRGCCAHLLMLPPGITTGEIEQSMRSAVQNPERGTFGLIAGLQPYP